MSVQITIRFNVCHTIAHNQHINKFLQLKCLIYVIIFIHESYTSCLLQVIRLN